jgi:hypothetical protein
VKSRTMTSSAFLNLERCVGGFPPGVLPPVAIAGHKIAWARFQETSDPEWRDVAIMSLRAICMARQTEEEVALMLQYVCGLPVAAWWNGHGWSRRQMPGARSITSIAIGIFRSLALSGDRHGDRSR